MDDNDNEDIKNIGTCCCGIACITFLILIISSFSSLDTNEIGLDYSSISEQINPEPFGAGIHFLGIGHSFIKFPKSVITLDFSGDSGANYPPVRTRTSDGLEVTLSLSFQFTLFDIYSKFYTDYTDTFQKIAVDILSMNATEYSAYNFFMNRSLVGNNMQDALNKIYLECCWSQIEFFQLKDVDLPDQFEDAIQNSEVKKQEIQKAVANKNKSIIELNTEYLSASYQKNVTINLAQGYASQIIQHAQAQANATLVVQQQNSLAYKNLKDTLALSSEELLKYIKLKLIRSVQDKNLIISIPDPLQQSSSSGSSPKASAAAQTPVTASAPPKHAAEKPPLPPVQSKQTPSPVSEPSTVTLITPSLQSQSSEQSTVSPIQNFKSAHVSQVPSDGEAESEEEGEKSDLDQGESEL